MLTHSSRSLTLVLLTPLIVLAAALFAGCARHPAVAQAPEPTQQRAEPTAATPAAAQGPVVFETRTIEAVGVQPFAVAATDFNSDGFLDLAVTDPQGGVVIVIPGKGDGTFAPREQWSAVAAGDLPRGIAVGDLDGNGTADIVVAATYSNAAVVLLGDGKGTFPRRRSYKGGPRPFAVAIGDFNEDGRPEVVMANESNADLAHRGPGVVDVFLNDGKGGFSRQPPLEAGLFPADVQVGDFNGDHHLDLVVANWGSDDASIFLGDGRGQFRAGQRPKPEPSIGAPYSVQVADFNADGYLDVVLTGLAQPRLALMLGDGHGDFRQGPRGFSGHGCRSMTVADLNGDGRLDLASANTGSNDVTVSLADTTGDFTLAATIPAAAAPRWVTAADLDRDGRPDLVVTNMESRSLTVLLNRTPFPARH